MFCKYCGNQIDDDAVFCSSCGKKVADANAQENEQTVNETTQQEPVTQVTNETQQQETQSNTPQTDAQQPKQYNDAATVHLLDAVKSRSVDKVKQLIADGANVNIIDADGWTPLMFASYCTLEMVQVLLAAGAIVDVKSKVGQTALSLAQDNRTSDKDAIIELLQQYENGTVQSAQEEANNYCVEVGFNFHRWIVENGLEMYENLLKSQDCDTEEILVSITEKDLAKIGIETTGGQVKLLNAIQKLKSQNNIHTLKKEFADSSSVIPSRCPKCGAVWGVYKENGGAISTLGKALVGGVVLGPIGIVGGAAFGNKTVVYICNKCGFKKQYKSSVVKEVAQGAKNIFTQ